MWGRGEIEKRKVFGQIHEKYSFLGINNNEEWSLKLLKFHSKIILLYPIVLYLDSKEIYNSLKVFRTIENFAV